MFIAAGVTLKVTAVRLDPVHRNKCTELMGIVADVAFWRRWRGHAVCTGSAASTARRVVQSDEVLFVPQSNHQAPVSLSAKQTAKAPDGSLPTVSSLDGDPEATRRLRDCDLHDPHSLLG